MNSTLRKWSKFASNLFTAGFILATILLTCLSLAGYLGELYRHLELTSHFKLQYLLINFCLFFFFLLKHQKIWLVLSLICLIINLVEVTPWYFPHSIAINSTNNQTVRVLLSNINKHGAQYPQVISMVNTLKPDIAILLEVGKKGAKELKILRKTLPYSWFFRT